MKVVKNPRILLVGSVNSSRKTLEKLIEHNMNIVGVLGLDPSASEKVSGYVDLEKIALQNDLHFNYFKRINSEDTTEFVRSCDPDYMFVIGLSQMVKKPLLDIPAYGCIGFHPTKLPEGRGRGAVAWLILGKAPAAATFFIMGEGMDDGPILVQEEFDIGKDDYSQDVINKIVEAIGTGLDSLLPQMKDGNISYTVQDPSQASYLGKRNPEDGLIDWKDDASDIYKLIRAVSDPLPGAYSYYQGHKVIIESAIPEDKLRITGVTGGILKTDNEGVLVQTGSGLLWLTKVRGIELDDLRIGKKFGMNFETEIQNLKREIQKYKKIQVQ